MLDDGGEKTASVTAVLYKDGEKCDTAVLSEENDWAYTWEALAAEYTWTVREEVVPEGFTSSVARDGNAFTITNNDKPSEPEEPDEPDTPSEPDATDVTVRKVWVLDNGGEMADSVTVALYRNGVEYDTVVLSEDNGWTHTWYDLDANRSYTVEELDVPEGFTSGVSSRNRVFTITNDDIGEETPAPSESVEPTMPAAPSDDVPQTGDESRAGLYLAGMGLSLAGLGVLAVLGRRKRGAHEKR